MAVIDWTAVRKQLAANARAVTVNGRPLHATHFPVTRVTNMPVVSVQNIRAQFDQAMGRGVDQWDVVIRVFAGTTDNMQSSSDLLDQICTPDEATSLRA